MVKYFAVFVRHNNNLRFVGGVLSSVLILLLSYLLLLWYLHAIPERPVFSEYYISSGNDIPEKLGGQWVMALPIVDREGNRCFVDSAFNSILVINNNSCFINCTSPKNGFARNKRDITLRLSAKQAIKVHITPNTLYIIDATNKIARTLTIRWGTAERVKSFKRDYFYENEEIIANVYDFLQDVRAELETSSARDGF